MSIEAEDVARCLEDSIEDYQPECAALVRSLEAVRVAADSMIVDMALLMKASGITAVTVNEGNSALAALIEALAACTKLMKGEP